MVAIAFAGYQFGASLQSQQNDQQVSDSQIELPEVVSDQSLRKMEARLQAIQSRLDAVKQKSEVLDNSIADVKTQDISGIEAAQARIEALPDTAEQKNVPLPEDSPSAKVLNQPKTASGIPVKVLENYQQETGVSPDEVEALMQRTE